MSPTRAGLLYATVACCGWGFAFVGPLILGAWSASEVAAGRYIAYGLGSIVTLSWLRARQADGVSRSGRLWRDAALLTLSGNLLYYVLLSVAVQKAGYVMPTLIIGLLPVTVSLAGRLREKRSMSWRYAVALILILAGLWLAHAPGAVTSIGSRSDASHDDYILGIVCALGSLALWTVYGVVNTERLRANPNVSGLAWSSMQGATALPFALLLFIAVPDTATHSHADWTQFIAISLVLGLLTSWLANTFWNLASTRLPTSLLGQLIVLETIAGIAYGALWSGASPGTKVLAGIVILVAGIVVAVSEKAPPVDLKLV